jgi:hypothetical protein
MKGKAMTPEEAEAKLLAACREAVKRGMRIVPSPQQQPDCCCPLGAMLGAKPGDGQLRRYPIPDYCWSQLRDFRGRGLWQAFDSGKQITGDLAPLGCKFRQLALSGGFDEQHERWRK